MGFATAESVAALLGRDDEPELVEQCAEAVEVVSFWITAHTGLGASPTVGAELTLQGTRERKLVVGHRPLAEVASVVLDGQELTDYRSHRYGWLWREAGWGDTASTVAVICDYGLEEVPPELGAVCRTAAARLATNPAQLTQETTEGYSTMNPVFGFTLAERLVLDRWRRKTSP